MVRRTSQRRFAEHIQTGNPRILDKDHSAVVEGSTFYRARVSDVADHERIFKSGIHSRKIGSHVVKGAWSGMPIFTLTLEERATCPRSCLHWYDCYGNKMNWSARLRHGPELEERIKYEIRRLADVNPRGFVVRLHILGDFYSVGYIKLWISMLRLHPQLHIFGYTAWSYNSAKGHLIGQMNDIDNRCLIRFSDEEPGWVNIPKTVTLENESEGVGYNDKHPTASPIIICPAQTGKTDCCGTCALCWAAPNKTIAFLRH
jgi:hypothetical protein